MKTIVLLQIKKLSNLFRDRRENITKLPIGHAVWLLAIPTALRLLSHFLFEVIDAFWVGHLGKQALAAVGGSSFYIWAYFSLMGITVTGANTVVAQAIGGDNHQRARRLAFTGLVSSCCCAVLFMLFYMLLKEKMLYAVGLRNDTWRMAMSYFGLFVWASPIYYLWVFFEEIINARGQTQINFMITLTAITVNIILDPILIYGWWCFPKLGVAGAQVASIIAALLGLTLCVCFCLYRCYLASSGFDLHTVWNIVRIGFPRVISSLMFSLTYLGLAYLIQQFGEEALGAWMVCHRLEGFAFFCSLGFATSAAVMAGQYIGANRRDLAQKSIYYNIGSISIEISFIKY